MAPMPAPTAAPSVLGLLDAEWIEFLGADVGCFGRLRGWQRRRRWECLCRASGGQPGCGGQPTKEAQQECTTFHAPSFLHEAPWTGVYELRESRKGAAEGVVTRE